MCTMLALYLLGYVPAKGDTIVVPVARLQEHSAAEIHKVHVCAARNGVKLVIKR